MSGEEATTSELFQLDRAFCLTLVSTQHVGRLVVGGDEPVVIPVNYRLVDGVITFRTEAGSGADRAAGRAAAFEVDMFDERTRSGWSVVVRGALAVVEPNDTTDLVDTWAPGARDRCMTVTVDVVTGRLLRSASDGADDRAGGYL